MKTRKYPGLEIDDDPRQQSREWVVQRISWVLLTVLLVAIAFGLFGRGGPISKVEAGSEDGSFQIEYDRFMRYHSPDMLRVTFKAPSDRAQVKIDNQYAKQIQLEQITPEPEQEISEDGAITYVFATRPGTTTHVTFYFTPQKYGMLEGWIAVGDKARHPFSQFVYP